MVERLLERLETGIESAASQERFKEASALRDEISRMHMDDSSAVLKVNSDFYRAFSTKNITLMGTVWHNSPYVQCIHPGAKPLVGYDNIVSMWSNMFPCVTTANTRYKFMLAEAISGGIWQLGVTRFIFVLP